jgi:hypothetical protein
MSKLLSMDADKTKEQCVDLIYKTAKRFQVQDNG